MAPFLFRTQGWRLVLALACVSSCERGSDPSRKFVQSGDGYLLVLREGDDAFTYLETFADEQNIEGATFSGFGFGHATFGYFDHEKKDFDRRAFRDVEIASLTGSIARKDGAASLHVHAVATDRDFAAHGGHLLELQVGKGSLELQLTTRYAPLNRQRDEQLGADVLVLPR